LEGMKGSDFIWLKMRADGEQFDWLIYSGFEPLRSKCLIDGPFVHHNQ
jgi:hypothetical protein